MSHTHIYIICVSYISYIYIYICIYIYIYISNIFYIKYRVSTELRLWFRVWAPLAALSVNLLGKYLFFN